MIDAADSEGRRDKYHALAEFQGQYSAVFDDRGISR